MERGFEVQRIEYLTSKIKVMIRCIVYSDKSGSREGVYFTEDLTADSSDFIPYGCTVDMDFQLDEFPTGFPMEYNLVRQ